MRNRGASYGPAMEKRYEHDWSRGPDSDGDGLSDAFETAVLGTDPTKRDSDGDGLSDLREKDFGSDPTKWDTDGDLQSDGREVTVGTSPFMPDTDGDGVDDRAETIAGTAHAPDEDGDGTADWVQSVRGADMDGDGLTDGEEQWLRTNILTGNTDEDDIDDLQETQFGGDLGRNPRDMDGRLVPQIPSTPENPGIVPDLDLGDPNVSPQAAVEEPVPAPEPQPEPEVVVLADDAPLDEAAAADAGAGIDDVDAGADLTSDDSFA